MYIINVGIALALLALIEIGRADPLDTWTWRNPLPTGDNLSCVVHGNGRFVALGWSDTTLTSADGLSWVLERPGADGTNWVQRQSRTQNFLHGIAYGNGQFMATGDAGTILSSTDGVNWVERQSGLTGWLGGIAYGNGRFVAVWHIFWDRFSFATSVDGVNWTRADESSNTFGVEGAVAYGNGQFVAVGSNGAILTSTDGINWLQRPVGSEAPLRPTRNWLRGIAYGNGQFVAAGYGGNILQSGSIINLSITRSTDTGSLTLSSKAPPSLNTRSRPRPIWFPGVM